MDQRVSRKWHLGHWLRGEIGVADDMRVNVGPGECAMTVGEEVGFGEEWEE